MKRLLVVSPLDMESSNSRTYHMVRHLAPHFKETIAISRTDLTQRTYRDKLVALFRVRTDVSEQGKIRWVRMSHWGNICHGLGLRLLGMKNPYSVPRWGLRRILRQVLNLFGTVFELGVFPSLIITFVSRVRGHVDVFVGEGPWEVCFGLFLRLFGKTSLVVYDDLDYAPGFQPVRGPRQNIIASLERFGVNHADVVISVGKRLADLRRKQGARNVYIIPNGVDREKFMVACQKRREKDRRYLTLIYIGYLGSWSGVNIILDAAAIVSQWIPNLRVIFVGQALQDELSAIRSRICNLDVGNIVDLRGKVAYGELPVHLAEADVGLAMFQPLDVTRYAFPLKVVEYMAAGLPVLTTKGTEAADLVTRTGTGEAVSFEEMALANAVFRMYKDTATYRQYSENAENYSKSYDWSQLVQNAYEIIDRNYREILERRGS